MEDPPSYLYFHVKKIIYFTFSLLFTTATRRKNNNTSHNIDSNNIIIIIIVIIIIIIIIIKIFIAVLGCFLLITHTGEKYY